MAKTGYKVDYVVRALGADLSDLLAIHQKYFPNNQLSILQNKTHVIVKVSNNGEISGMNRRAAMDSVGYKDTTFHG